MKEAQQESLFRSSDFYHMAGTTRNTLRHYVESGLISPALVNESGYAFYGERELLQMQMIRFYRSCNLSVDEVKEFLWDMDLPSQIGELDAALSDLDRQIDALQRKRADLATRRFLLHDSTLRLNKPFLDEAGRRMYLMNVVETMERMGPAGAEAIRDLSLRLPTAHISLMADWRDFVARRDMPVQLGYGLTERSGLDAMDPALFHVIPAHRCLVVRVRVTDPLRLTPQDLQPLYDEVERGGYQVVDGVFGHLLSMERQNGVFYYYITMRVHIQ